ncbi:Stress response protein nst1 [Ceratobasidium sp. 392]|nr:Stress response protein nst1 [Ceratobasidium sp. 392]
MSNASPFMGSASSATKRKKNRKTNRKRDPTLASGLPPVPPPQVSELSSFVPSPVPAPALNQMEYPCPPAAVDIAHLAGNQQTQSTSQMQAPPSVLLSSDTLKHLPYRPPYRLSDASPQRRKEIGTRLRGNDLLEERELVKGFWLELGKARRRDLIEAEYKTVLKWMRNQQKHSCKCTVCIRRQVGIEHKLEVLYITYHEQLENYADHQEEQYAIIGGNTPHLRLGPFFNRAEFDVAGEVVNARHPIFLGDVLTVLDDFLEYNGEKFLEMMERLRTNRRAKMAKVVPAGEDEQEDAGKEEEDFDQAIAAGECIFSTFAAPMLEERVRTAYQEQVAQERQLKLLLELENEERAAQEIAKKKNLKKKRTVMQAISPLQPPAESTTLSQTLCTRRIRIFRRAKT